MTINLPDWLAPYANAVLGRSPFQAFLIGVGIGWAICPVFVYLLGLSELRWLRYRDQFKAFMPGNLFLGVSFGCICYLAAEAQRHGTGWFVRPAETWWLWVAVGFSILLTVGLWLVDIIGAFRHRSQPGSTYSWWQLISWTKVYHNTFVYGVYSLLLVGLGVPGLILAPFNTLGLAIRLLMVVVLLSWVMLLIEDGKHPMHRTAHIELRGFGGAVRWVLGLVYIVIAAAVIASLPVG